MNPTLDRTKSGARRQSDTALRIFFPLLLLTLSLTLSGCFIIRPFAGANIDVERLQKAREAKVLQIRRDGAQKLQQRLAAGDSLSNADLTFTFSEALLNKAAAQLDGSTGWMDSLTSYTIRSIRVKLYNGSAIATVSMAAFNHSYDVDVNLQMDCLLTFRMDNAKPGANGVLAAQLEPFNVVPTVKAGGMISTFDGMIEDILTMKLSTMSDQLPPIQFPVDFNNQFPVQGNSVQVRSGMNMNITTPAQTLQYSLAVKEVQIFKEQLFVAMNIRNAGVKK